MSLGFFEFLFFGWIEKDSAWVHAQVSIKKWPTKKIKNESILQRENHAENYIICFCPAWISVFMSKQVKVSRPDVQYAMLQDSRSLFDFSKFWYRISSYTLSPFTETHYGQNGRILPAEDKISSFSDYERTQSELLRWSTIVNCTLKSIYPIQKTFVLGWSIIYK